MKAYREIAGRSRSAVPAFLLGSGPSRQWHTLVDSYCEKPNCEGGEGIVRLLPERDPESALEFWVDLLEGTIRIGLDGGEETKVLVESFAREQWDLLARRRQVVRAWGLLRLRRQADYRPGKRYGFRDFQARKDHFTLLFDDGGIWQTTDRYCVNPECPCTDVELQFFAQWKGGEVLRPEFIALLNLQTGSALDLDGRPLLPEVARVLEAFQNSLGDWCGELSLRKALVRRIAAKRLRFAAADQPAVVAGDTPLTMTREVPGVKVMKPAAGETPPPARLPAAMPPTPEPLRRDRPRIGRNDPCSCGSGKKYKRCCGR